MRVNASPQRSPGDSLDLAVVIPSFRAAATIGKVLAGIGPEVNRIYVVDDGCPDATGLHVADQVSDPRVVVLHNETNLGVGGAMKHGYRRALADGARIIVKLDSDGQMDPAHIPLLIDPVLRGEADYSKGNRLAPAHLMPLGTSPNALRTMPPVRRVANRLLSLVHKGATGYWRIGDPANGYTAIHADALRQMKLEELADCYFFETDMLFALRRISARVADIPLPACYSDEVSSVRLRRVAPRFLVLMARRLVDRIVANPVQEARAG